MSHEHSYQRFPLQSVEKQAPPEDKSGNNWAELTLSMGSNRHQTRPALSSVELVLYHIYSSPDPHWLQAVHLNGCQGFYAQS